MTTELRRLGPEHRDEISEFTCARYRQPWTEAVQDMVRNGLVYALENGVAEAVGLWSEQELVAISAWIVQDDATWRSVVLAVATGHSRRGYGGRLKRDLTRRDLLVVDSPDPAGAVRVALRRAEGRGYLYRLAQLESENEEGERQQP